MSRTTREINRITTTIISMSVRLLFYALVFFLLYEGITRGYSLGHEVGRSCGAGNRQRIHYQEW